MKERLAEVMGKLVTWNWGFRVWLLFMAQVMKDQLSEVRAKLGTLGSVEKMRQMQEDLTNLIAWGHVRSPPPPPAIAHAQG